VTNAPTRSLDTRAITFEKNMLQQIPALYTQLNIRPSIVIKFQENSASGEEVAFTRKIR